jgi:N-acetylneuraminate epimerase
MLAVAGGADGGFYLFSGVRLRGDSAGRPVREYLRDAWRYRTGEGCRRLADPPRAAVAAPSPAPSARDGRLLIISGDDGTKVGFRPEAEHPGFPRNVLSYDPARDTWGEGRRPPRRLHRC